MRQRTVVVAIVALVLLCIPLVAYVFNFGTSWSSEQDVWGQFGDFVGGLLNPIYALLALLALLYNLRLQGAQAESAQKAAGDAAASAQAQIDAIRQRVEREELLSIIHVLSQTIDACYAEVVSTVQSHPQLKLHHVVHEGWRLRHASVKSSAYDQYLQNARATGSIIEALHGRLVRAAKSYAEFVTLYRATHGASSPVARFYESKYVGLGQLLADVGGSDSGTILFFTEAERGAV